MKILSQRPRRESVKIVLAGVVAVVASLLWPSTGATTTSASGELAIASPVGRPTGPVEIVAVGSSATWVDSVPPSIQVTVRNRSDRPTRALLWWFLAKRGEAEPWAHSQSRSETVRVTLEAGERREVEVSAQLDPPSGTWALSLWAHTAGPDDSAPSHGVSVAPEVTVLPTDPNVFRLSQPNANAVLSSIDAAGQLSGAPASSGPDATVSVQSTTGQPVALELRCYLAPVGVNEPWRHPVAVVSKTRRLTVDAGHAKLAGCEFAEVPDQGDWQLSAFVRRSGPADADTHEDGVYARRTLTFGDDDPRRTKRSHRRN